MIFIPCSCQQTHPGFSWKVFSLYCKSMGGTVGMGEGQGTVIKSKGWGSPCKGWGSLCKGWGSFARGGAHLASSSGR